MDEHIHTGFITFVTVGVYAVVFMWLLRIVGAKLVDYPPTEAVGKAVGGLVHFGA